MDDKYIKKCNVNRFSNQREVQADFYMVENKVMCIPKSKKKTLPQLEFNGVNFYNIYDSHNQSKGYDDIQGKDKCRFELNGKIGVYDEASSNVLIPPIYDDIDFYNIAYDKDYNEINEFIFIASENGFVKIFDGNGNERKDLLDSKLSRKSLDLGDLLTESVDKEINNYVNYSGKFKINYKFPDFEVFKEYTDRDLGNEEDFIEVLDIQNLDMCEKNIDLEEVLEDFSNEKCSYRGSLDRGDCRDECVLITRKGFKFELTKPFGEYQFRFVPESDSLLYGLFDLDGNLRFAYPRTNVSLSNFSVDGQHIFTMLFESNRYDWKREPIAITTKDKNYPVVKIDYYPVLYDNVFILTSNNKYRMLLLNGKLLGDVYESMDEAKKFIDSLTKEDKYFDVDIKSHQASCFRK